MEGGERSDFYGRVLGELLDRGALERSHSILVVAGGPADRAALLAAGFENVTISNIDESASAEEFAPYRWARQDAEGLALDDGSYDFVLVSAGLHHCASPHLALLEMYRVARRGLLAIESRDSLLMRLAIVLHASDEFELTAVVAHDFASGGVRNTAVPNYVYRWTEREVEKTIASNAPYARHRILYFRELELPVSILEFRRNGLWALALRIATPVLGAVAKAFPSQANLFAFCVLKPELPRDLHPWLRSDGEAIVPNESWLRARLRPKEPARG
jgi:ubiquinone/menaquinone biosynthesis C-methylase UbiE